MRHLPIRNACLGMLGFLTLLCQIPLVAQADPNFTQDFQTWQLGTIQGHITKRILGYLDTQNNEINLTNRRGNSSNNNTHQGQLLIRPAIGFQVTKGWSIWQGYGWTPSFQPQFRNENQIFEQIIYQHRFKHLAFSNRTRLELRWIENTNGQTALRVRNQLRVVVPLGKTRWGLVAFDEPYYNLNTVPTGQRSGFNQNWLFIGLERRLNNFMNLDVGYVNNYVRNFQPTPDRMNHVIFAWLAINVPGTGWDLRRPSPSQVPLQIKSSMVPTTPMAPSQQEALIPSSQPNLEIDPITPAVAETQASQAKVDQKDTLSAATKIEGSSINLAPAESKPAPAVSPTVESQTAAP